MGKMKVKVGDIITYVNVARVVSVMTDTLLIRDYDGKRHKIRLKAAREADKRTRDFFDRKTGNFKRHEHKEIKK